MADAMGDYYGGYQTVRPGAIGSTAAATSLTQNFLLRFPWSYHIIEGIGRLNPKYEIFDKLAKRFEEKIQPLSVFQAYPPPSDPYMPEGAGIINIDRRYHDFMYANIEDVDKVRRLQEYRRMASFSEIAECLDEICDELMVKGADGNYINFDLKGDYEESIKSEVKKEWNKFIEIFNIEEKGWGYFRNFLIDGEIFFENIISSKNIDLGILGVVQIPSELINPVYDNASNMIIKGFVLKRPVMDIKSQITQRWKEEIIPMDYNQVTYINSGIWNENRTIRLPFLENARRAYKQLSLIEDSLIIYRLCLEGNSRVRTNNGYKYIKDIKVGDIVYSYSKQLKPISSNVINCVNNGKKKVIRVRSCHNELICTETHPILVKDTDDNIIKYVEASKLIKGRHQLINASVGVDDNGKKIDFLGYIKEHSKNTKFNVFKINKNKKISKKDCNFEKINLPKYINKEFARLFGFLVGSGYIEKNKIGFNKHSDSNINEYYLKLLEKYFGTYILYKNIKCGRYIVNNNSATELFINMGYVKDLKNRRIPQWVFESSKDIKQKFIEGIFDSNKCEQYINNGKWNYLIEFCNKRLIEDIKELWSSIGLCSSHISNKKKLSEWVVILTKIPLDKYENVLEIENFGETEVYDITVDNEEHNFIANNIPVHNTRAPERLVFYVDVGNMSPPKAESYLKRLMQNFYTRKNYDAGQGKMSNIYDPLSQLDAYWFARRTGSDGTKVEVLPGGANLGQLEDLNYFIKKLYKSLKVPESRLTPQTTADSNEAVVTREELRFANFCIRIQQQFAMGIRNAFITHLKLRQLWDKYKLKETKIDVNFNLPSNFMLMRNQQIINIKFNNFNNISSNPFISTLYTMRHYLDMSDRQIAENILFLKKQAALQWELDQIKQMGPDYKKQDFAQASAEAAGGAPGGMEIPSGGLPALGPTAGIPGGVEGLAKTPEELPPEFKGEVGKLETKPGETALPNPQATATPT